MAELTYFFSYARKDSEFVLRLAKELREVGVNLWLDQLDIVGGQHWDRAVEGALETCQGMIAVLSPEALASNNVMDEVSYALEERKMIIPIFLRSCTIPFRLRRVQYIDFTAGYNTGFSQLLRALRIDQPSQPREPGAPEDTVVRGVTAPLKETPKEVPILEQQPIQTEPPEPESAAPAKLIRKQVVMTSMGWAIGGAVGRIIVWPHHMIIMDHIHGEGVRFIVWVIGWAISWIISVVVGSFIMGQALRTIEPSFQRKQVVMTSVGWAIGGAVGWSIGWSIGWTIVWVISGDDSWSMRGWFYGGGYIIRQIREAISWIISGAVGGFIMGQALRTIEPSFQRKQVVMTSVGWAIGGAVGWSIRETISNAIDYERVGWVMVTVALSFSVFGIFGAIGGGTTFRQLISVRSRVFPDMGTGQNPP